MKNNEITETNRIARNHDLRDSFCRFENLDDFLKSLHEKQPVVDHPQSEVEISVEPAIREVADATMSFLETVGIERNDQDKTVVTDVLRVQVQAKVACAREEACYASGVDEETLTRVVKLFSTTFNSHAVFLDQVGNVTVDGQRITPRLAQPCPAARPLGPEWRRSNVTTINDDGGAMDLYYLADEEIEGRAAILQLPDERQQWRDHRVIDLRDLHTRWIDLLSRCSDSINRMLTKVDYKMPIGTAAQIVGSQQCPSGGVETEAWALRKLPISVIQLGAGYGFGRIYPGQDPATIDPWHRRGLENCFVRANVTCLIPSMLRLNEEGSVQPHT